jgi:cytochrome P450
VQSVREQLSERLNPFEDAFLEDPYSRYSKWRRLASVHWGYPPEPSADGCWYVLGYAAARSALTDDRLGVELARALPEAPLPTPEAEFRPFFDLISRWMVFRDPPYHTQAKKLLAPWFVRSSVTELKAQIRRLAAALVEQHSRDAEVDVITALAFPLPVMTIALVLGIDHDELPLLKQWSHALLSGIDLKRAREAEAAYANAAQATEQLSSYLKGLIGLRRRHPSEDLLSTLVQTCGDDDEIVAHAALLLFAGHETTVNLIGNGTLALLRNPSELELLRSRPDLIGTAIEEMARYDSPSQMTFRYVLEPYQLGGCEVRRGDPVAIVIGAANRDEAEFPHADRFDVRRSPNRHLSFGLGRHMCLGGTLARLEAEAALHELLRAFPRMELVAEPLQWAPSIGLRGLSHLRIRTGYA